MNKKNKKERRVILASADFIDVSLLYYIPMTIYTSTLNSPQYMLSISDRRTKPLRGRFGAC
jgi:hypothetical protein